MSGDQPDASSKPKNGIAGASPPKATSRHTKKEIKRVQAEQRQVAHRKLSPVNAKIADLEVRIGELEKRHEQLQGILADPQIYEDSAQSVPLLSEFDQVKSKLEELMARWEHQNEKAAIIRTELGLDED